MILIGIDIGGTHTRVAAVSEEGHILRRISISTAPERGPDRVIQELIAQVREFLKSLDSPTPLLSIGVGVTGPVDVVTGIVTNPYTLTNWPPTDLLTPLKRAFPHATVTIDNDANVAAFGEWVAGAGRGSERFALVTLGTGIGVGFIARGTVQRARDGRHSEAGHQVLDPSGPPCYCGARGCWEVLASGTALRARLQGRPITSTDPEVRDIVRQMADWIGLGLVNLCAIFAPDTIAIGGGMGAHLGLMREVIDRRLRQHRTMIPCDVPIVAAQHGDEAGVIGAALMARQRQAV